MTPFIAALAKVREWGPQWVIRSPDVEAEAFLDFREWSKDAPAERREKSRADKAEHLRRAIRRAREAKQRAHRVTMLEHDRIRAVHSLIIHLRAARVLRAELRGIEAGAPVQPLHAA